jgi:hypothetical protein
MGSSILNVEVLNGRGKQYGPENKGISNPNFHNDSVS